MHSESANVSQVCLHTQSHTRFIFPNPSALSYSWENMILDEVSARCQLLYDVQCSVICGVFCGSFWQTWQQRNPHMSWKQEFARKLRQGLSHMCMTMIIVTSCMTVRVSAFHVFVCLVKAQNCISPWLSKTLQ